MVAGEKYALLLKETNCPDPFRVAALNVYWSVFDNSGDLPSMIVFEESGKLKILDNELFELIVQHTE